jgi:phosphoglucomutase
MDELIRKKVAEWTKPPFDADTIREITQIISEHNMNDIEDRFYRDLEFGTGGLRGVIGAGTNRMNIYTVGMATQGLANYIKSSGGMNKGVVIAYDSRRMSRAFSREAACVLAGNGIQVYLFQEITPTPLASYAIRKLKAVSGIVITASHNPPEYNGYKVYWEDGGQIVPPHDRNIISEVSKIGGISKIQTIDFDQGLKTGKIRIIADEITESYIADLKKTALRHPAASTVKIIYTPLHGTGYRIIPRVLNEFGFSNIIIEPSQGIPDENFPTVTSPNPEEKEALSRALALAQKENADIILATDPDADRMGIGFKNNDGTYSLINGNQIGTMMEYYILSRLKEMDKLPKNAAVIKTIVTTELQRDIARSFGCSIDDVLTGFKWIAARMKDYDEKGNHTFIFGGEESFGYLPVPFVRDKDAVSSCYFIAEMADWLKEKGQNFEDFLNEIYLKYGLYLEDLYSLTLKGIEGNAKIRDLMNGFRNSPPREFAGIPVERIDDIQSSTSKSMADGSETAIKGLPKSDVMQFFLNDGSKITMRPSGTEPKIKFYFSVKIRVTEKTLDQGKIQAKDKIERIRDGLLEMVRNY